MWLHEVDFHLAYSAFGLGAASALSYIKFGYYQQTLAKRIWLE